MAHGVALLGNDDAHSLEEPGEVVVEPDIGHWLGLRMGCFCKEHGAQPEARGKQVAQGHSLNHCICTAADQCVAN